MKELLRLIFTGCREHRSSGFRVENGPSDLLRFRNAKRSTEDFQAGTVEARIGHDEDTIEGPKSNLE